VCPLNWFIVVSLFLITIFAPENFLYLCTGGVVWLPHRLIVVFLSFLSLFFVFSICTAVLFDAAASSHHCSKYNHAHVVSLSLPQFFPGFSSIFHRPGA